MMARWLKIPRAILILILILYSDMDSGFLLLCTILH